MSMLGEINRQDRTTVIVSLHQIDHAFEHCDRIIALKEGRVIHNGPTTDITPDDIADLYGIERSEEHTSELQSLMRISYAVFCLKNKKKLENTHEQPRVETHYHSHIIPVMYHNSNTRKIGQRL